MNLEHRCWPLLALILSALALSACKPSTDPDDPQDPPPEPPPGTTYRVSGEIVDKRYDGELRMELMNADTFSVYETLTTTENGPFEFTTRVAEGDNIQVNVDVLGRTYLTDSNGLFRQYCSEFMTVRDVRDDVMVTATCKDLYHVFGTVEGMDDVRVSSADYLVLDSNKGDIDVSQSRSFRFGPYEDDDLWELEIRQQPSNPDQECRIDGDSSGAVDESDVFGVRVLCEQQTIGGEVVGLIGSGMEVTLSIDKENGGSTIVFDVESLPIDANGAFEFEGVLSDGTYYEVAVRTQPTNPGQECTVENGSGIVEGPVSDVVIRCPATRRVFWYHDVNTMRTISRDFPFGKPLRCVDTSGEPVFDVHEYPMSLTVGFGGVANLQNLPPYFRDYLDPAPTEGVVYSNASGFTYWLGVDSGSMATVRPAGEPDPVDSEFACSGMYEGPIPPWPGNIRWNQNSAGLATGFRLRKDSESATITFRISKINLIGFIDAATTPCDDPACLPQINPATDIDFFVYTIDARTEERQLVHHQGGTVFLLGGLEEENSISGLRVPTWRVHTVTDSTANVTLFTDGNFEVYPAFGSPGLPDPRQVGFLELKEPIDVELDLSDVPLHAEFHVTTQALVDGYSYGSAEGGSAAYLRDPGEFDPEQQPELAGGTVTEMTGVSILEPDFGETTELLGGGVTSVSACEDPTAPRSSLEFSRTDYRLTEIESLNVSLDEVLVVRGGATDGDIGATVSATSGSAVYAADFTDDEVFVRFADQEDVPRTVNFGLVDDPLEEGDESFTIMLHSPEGCAEIGPQSIATVTILANDPSQGQAAFAADAITFDESAGEAVLEVLRLGGDAGSLIASVATADGTAIAGTDYIGTSNTVVWGDGDSASKVVRVPLVDDIVPEVDKDFTAQLSAEDADLVTLPTTITVTIRDDDAAAISRFELGSASYSVDEPAGTVAIDVLRLDSTVGQSSVQLTTQSDTANAGDDFVDLATTIDFADGDGAAKTVAITILDDAELEGDHRFSVAISSPVNGVLGTLDMAVVNIVDDEGVSTAPPAPILDVTPEIGELEFNWSSISEATYFRLLGSPDGVSPFAQIGDDIPAGQFSQRISIAVHLIDWSAARYRVQACNSAGCTDSNDVTVAQAMLDAIGYFKASNTEGVQQRGNGDAFGYSIAISGDGRTLAVGAPNEDSDAILINGDQSNNDASDSGAVYLFQRGVDGWVQQAYIKAPFGAGPFLNTNRGDEFGSAVALSENGNRLVVTAPEESGTASGVDGVYATSSDTGGSGAAYVYERSGGVWTFVTYFKASNTGKNDNFGHAAAISDDGDTIVISAAEEDSSATGIDPPDQEDNTASDAGAVYVFHFDGGNWAQTAYFKASNAEAGDRFGDRIAISGDGLIVAVSAFGEDSAATGIDGDQSDNSFAGSGSRSLGTGAVYLFSLESGAWVQAAYVKPSNTGEEDQFGASLALNIDGSLLAVGASREDSAGTGVDSVLEQDDTAPDAGAVYVFRDSGALWVQDAYIKASNAERLNLFGASVALTGETYLAVGATSERSNALGVNGSEAQMGLVGVGAAYVYTRDATGWRKISYVKATNSDQSSFGDYRGLRYGNAIVMSDDGSELVVGGVDDPSDATGIGGDGSNDNASNAGAVYVY